MTFKELPSRVATLWGTRTLSTKKFHLDVLDEVHTDGKNGRGVEVVDLEDGENVRLRAATMARKRELLKRYQIRCETTRKNGFQVASLKNFSEGLLKKIPPSFLSKTNFIENILKKIEGKFGFTILSYFHFVLWLLAVNFLLSILILLFIIIPQSSIPPYEFMEYCSKRSLKADDPPNNFTEEACERTKSYSEWSSKEDKKGDSTTQQFVDFLQGTGWMEGTLMFYGSYFTKNVKSSHYYNMGLAFLLVFAAYFLIFLVLTVAYSANSIRQRMLTYKKLLNLSPSHVPVSSLAGKLFTGWDFAITDRDQAEYRHKLITKLIMETCHEIIRHRSRKPPAFVDKLKLCFVRVLVNILILTLIVLSLAGIVASSVTQPDLLAHDKVKDNSALKLLCSFLPPISVAFFKFTMPLVFRALTKLEKYSPETQLNLLLLRSVLINLASLITLVVTIGIQLMCGHKQPCIDNIPCWETYIGQQLYKLCLVDFVVDIVSTLLDLVRRKLTDLLPQNKFLAYIALDSFDVPKNIIDVIYKQTVCWLGIFMAPMLTFVTTTKFILLFGLKSFTVLFNYKPSTKEQQRSFESRYFFAVVLLLSLFVCSALNVFAVGRILPSQSCGPFRAFTKDLHYMYSSATDVVVDVPSSVQTFIWFLGSWIFFVVVMVIISLFFLYYLSLASGNKKFASSLEAQLVSMKSLNLQYRKEILALRQRLGRAEH